MALVLQAYTFAYQYTQSWLHPVKKKNDGALKLGVLSSAQINAAAGTAPAAPLHSSTCNNAMSDKTSHAAFHPVETHPDVVLYGVASRDEATAKSVAKKYGAKKSYGSYQALLDDPAIDMVYVSVC